MEPFITFLVCFLLIFCGVALGFKLGLDYYIKKTINVIDRSDTYEEFCDNFENEFKIK